MPSAEEIRNVMQQYVARHPEAVNAPGLAPSAAPLFEPPPAKA